MLLLLAALPLAAGAAEARPDRPSSQLVEVVVGLDGAPLAVARPGRTLAATGGRRLSLSTPTSRSYLRTLASQQSSIETQIESALPGASVTRRYRVVANGLAVLVPRDQVARLSAVAGIARVYPSVRYRTLLDRSPGQIGAPALWGSGLENAGQGMKIGIIDEGIDQTHPLFDPRGYTMPAGYPKGQTAFTTAKVIVARAFPPPRPAWRHASKPFDPEHSSHGTHVAGIAAGNANTQAEGSRISGVAPRAYLGNYKALTIPTDADVGLDGNSPQLVAAIEAAVADGMDVINLSLGEPEIEPTRDIVAEALGAAARAGVVPVVAAGNDFEQFGRGSVSSPGSTPEAITVGAVSTTRSGAPGVVASFSSGGPTPLSLQLKPEVSAPGVSIVSAAPGSAYTALSGTSMAAPHVAGAVALLRQRHPTWTPAQVKSALATTGDRAFLDGARTTEAATTREGGGVVNLPRADRPLFFTSPVALSFGLIPATTTATQTLTLSDAGDGAGSWTVTVEPQTGAAGTTVTVPPTATVPGTLPVTVTTAGAPNAELSGFVVLTRGADRRRVPYWFRVSAPALGRAKTTILTKARPAQGDDAWRLDSRHDLPLSREPQGPRLPHQPARPRASLPRQPRAKGGELRRRGHLRGERRRRGAAHRRGRRREPPDRVSGAAVQPQPLPADLPGARPRLRGDPARPRGVRRRLRQPEQGDLGRVHVPLLDRGHQAAEADAAHPHRQAGRPGRRGRDRCRLGGRPALDRRPRRRHGAGGEPSATAACS